ncbi:hypothetical protein FACS1894184_06170 [Clostridia bacterium]|nr:hypothetical protein FACS1894184_06170 [Clostridia bacterium]
MRKSILLTAFEPFGGETVNPALEAVSRISDTISGFDIVKLDVPTVFGRSIQVVTDMIRMVNPGLSSVSGRWVDGQ